MFNHPTKYSLDEFNKMAARRKMVGRRMKLRMRLATPNGPRWVRVSGKFVAVGGTKDNLVFQFNSVRFGMNATPDIVKGLGLERKRIILWRPSLVYVPAASLRFKDPSPDVRQFLGTFNLKHLVWQARRKGRKTMDQFLPRVVAQDSGKQPEMAKATL